MIGSLLSSARNLFILSSLCVAMQVSSWAADEVLMHNGDRYMGKILSLSTNVLVMQSDVLGQIQLQRSQIAGITLNSASSPKPAQNAASTLRKTTPAGTNDLDSLVLQLGRSTNLVSDVQRGLLSEASPEATRRFNEMVKGLLTGRLTVEDVRAQAASAAQQLRQIKGELGEESGGVLDGYLKILEDFVNRAPVRSTNPPAK